MDFRKDYELGKVDEKQKKGEKDKRYLTKKGFYMDYDLKIAKTIPGSSKYN